MITAIENIQAREILDSRGNPTLEVTIHLTGGFQASASVPSGASTGIHEALEIRDGDKRYQGKGVRLACRHVNELIAKELKGIDASNQEAIDNRIIELDGTANKSRLGANATLGVSLACARAAARAWRLPLFHYLRRLFNFEHKPLKPPVPLFNIFNGGKHADTNLDFQEFIIIPLRIQASKAEKTFAARLRIGTEIFYELGRILKQKNLDTDVGNEGGYAPNIDSSAQAVELLLEAINRQGYKNDEIKIGIDAGASTLYDGHRQEYVFNLDGSRLTAAQLVSLWSDWVKKYPILYLEDPLWEDDWQSWQQITQELTHPLSAVNNKNQLHATDKESLLIVGDDLFVTNVERLKRGIAASTANAVIVKPNQVGTLSETIAFTSLAQAHNYKVIVSHRSGETNDDFIADLSVAVGADYIKAGAPNRGERVAKYNRLLKIEDLLEDQRHPSNSV